jgi:RNA polymerase sigma-70 factor (ECF subfamily)
MVEEHELAEALVGAVRGDDAAFAVLWRAWNPALLRYLRVLAGDACEDVASETWLQVSRDLGGFKGDPKGFQVWLFRIARNRAVDEARRAGRQPSEPVAEIPEQRAGDDTAEAALAAMATRRALAAIAELPPDQAEAVLLRAVAGLSAQDAAEVVGKRAGAVRIAAMRGLRALKKRLERERGAPEPDRAARAETTKAQIRRSTNSGAESAAKTGVTR